MGSPTVKRRVRYLLVQGWMSLQDQETSQQYFQQAHKEATVFVRLHTCAHASLFVHALIRRDSKEAQRELWLMFAAGPVTLRDRVIHFSRRNHS